MSLLAPRSALSSGRSQLDSLCSFRGNGHVFTSASTASQMAPMSARGELLHKATVVGLELLDANSELRDSLDVHEQQLRDSDAINSSLMQENQELRNKLNSLNESALADLHVVDQHQQLRCYLQKAEVLAAYAIDTASAAGLQPLRADSSPADTWEQAHVSITLLSECCARQDQELAKLHARVAELERMQDLSNELLSATQSLYQRRSRLYESGGAIAMEPLSWDDAANTLCSLKGSQLDLQASVCQPFTKLNYICPARTPAPAQHDNEGVGSAPWDSTAGSSRPAGQRCSDVVVAANTTDRREDAESNCAGHDGRGLKDIQGHIPDLCEVFERRIGQMQLCARETATSDGTVSARRSGLPKEHQGMGCGGRVGTEYLLKPTDSYES